MMLFKDDGMEKYAFCDPASASGRLKKQRARQAIVVIGVDYLMRVFILYAWAGRLETSAFRDQIIDVYDKLRPKKFGIEANGMQVLFGDLVKTEARLRLGQVTFVPVQQPTKVEKDFRIRTTLEPVINSGRLFLLKKQTALYDELRGFPTAETKDMVDALASAINLIPRRFVGDQREDGIKELASFLRTSGLSPAAIEKRIGEVRQELGLDNNIPFRGMESEKDGLFNFNNNSNRRF
jgi:hypothetical protein